ncbi:SDR family NAD(P)-dependent oxidoreductase [Hydrogenophaga sp. BPS33]|uniref:SDR family NAD(P)-dependent oxidoreductase n=1 Tax=Hydrogenophaga sp. BPS33 TaxID=2651974 RepID=UPI00131FD808|nr:glucose 1-dehydrogenase [Hydrogenophaga sp. BPS33]QHE84777.1 glucose 1-dehydrogenase [Hydrogenophaga sp. BPS33]
MANGRLEGKIAFITGSAAGIGKAAARLFAQEGASVVVADVNADAAQAVAALIHEAGGQALHVHLDVTSEDSVIAAVEAAMQKYGRIDILYNNAGASFVGDSRVTRTSLEEFRRTIDLNLTGTWLCCKHVIARMEATGGAVVNTSSAAGLIGVPELDSYTSSKGAILALTRSMAVEYAPARIRVNAVAPTSVTTERVLELYKHRPPTGLRAKNLLGPATPEDVAHAALFLASDDARVITGVVLPVDSGVTMC